MANQNNLFYSAVFIISLFYSNVAFTKAQNIRPFPSPNVPSISPQSSAILNEQVYDLKMTGATTTRDNQTICTGFLLPTSPNEFWIIQFEGKASASVVHHMALYGCDTPQTTNPCGCGMPNRSPLYSWVRYTPKVRYTGSGSNAAGGFRIGGSSDKKFLFLEIHYCHAGTTNDQSGITIHTTSNVSPSQFYDLALFPVMGLGTIPAGQAGYQMDTCTTSLPPVFDGNVYIIGFQVHSHNLGRLITGYVNQGGATTNIGQGNPLWPQGYVEIPYKSQINPSSGSLITTRCIYDSRGAPGDTNTNGRPKTVWGEMCILNLLVQPLSTNTPFNSTKNAFLKGTCSSSAVLDSIAASTTPLTGIPALDIAAAYGNITSGSYSYGDYGYNLNMEGETFTSTFK